MHRLKYPTVRGIFAANLALVATAVGAAAGFIPAILGVVAGAVGITGTVAALLAVRKAWTRREVELRTALNAFTTVDPLTGLPNRHFFNQAAQRVLQRSWHSKRPFVLVIWTLEGLKGINVASGLTAGDAVVVGFARLLEASARPTDLIARIGGAQFAALLPGGTRHTGMLLAARVGQQAWNAWRGNGFSASCAAAAYPADGETLESLFAAATPTAAGDAPFDEIPAGRGRPEASLAT